MGIFAYPRKKVQSRISSRLENDPLPLLSVFIDNMHVDEVQIDGGGTEAVITGNMENPGKRLIVLEGDEVEALYGRPRFTHEETETWCVIVKETPKRLLIRLEEDCQLRGGRWKTKGEEVYVPKYAIRRELAPSMELAR